LRTRFWMLCLFSLGITACSHEGPKTSFNGEEALGFVKTQLDFGPRIPGSPAHRKTGDWIVAQMRRRADTVIEQRWTHVTVHGDTLPLRNIIARFKPAAAQRILYLTHWIRARSPTAPRTPPNGRFPCRAPTTAPPASRCLLR